MLVKEGRRLVVVAGAVLMIMTVLAGCGGIRAARGASSAPTSSPSAPSAPAGRAVPYGAAVAPAVKATGKRIQGTLHTPDGRDRTYTVYVPSSLPRAGAVPLLIGLHGASGWGQQFEHNSGYDELAESNRFIAVYPDGITIAGLPKGGVWNAGACCAVAAQNRDNVDDVGFISMLVTKLEATYAIDPARVFVTGHSNGAMMGLRLACELSDKIDAVAVQSGALMVNGCAPSRPTPVMEIHGTADSIVPINGGKSGLNVPSPSFPPDIDTIHTIAAADGCPGGPAQTSTDPGNPAVGYQVWQPCAGGSLVEWAKIPGADHPWMGHPTPATEKKRGTLAYQGFDSTVATWSFLMAHSRV